MAKLKKSKTKQTIKTYNEEITSDESEIDDEVHDKLLRDIKYVDQPEELEKTLNKSIKKSKTPKKVDLSDLIGSIKSTRYNLN